MNKQTSQTENLICKISARPASRLPEVSVCTTVYNAEKYIAQTIESVLDQETSFSVEFVISDDCSCDGSSEIIKSYALRYPNVIRFRSNQRNIGLNANFMATMRECRGQFIALLDGDDYWSCQSKLQLQHDFLSKHPDCVACGTATDVLREDSGQFSHWPEKLPVDDGSVLFFSTEDMYKLDMFWIPTHTLFMRARFVDFPQWFIDVVYVDRALRLIISLHGKLAFINTTTGVYRKHQSNVSWDQCSSPAVARGYLHTYRNFFEYSGQRYRKAARFAINHSLIEERRRIRLSYGGCRVIGHLLSNTFSAFRYFRVLNTADLLRFPYHYLFVADMVLYFRRKLAGLVRAK